MHAAYPHTEERKFVHLHLKIDKNNSMSTEATVCYWGAPNAYSLDGQPTTLHISVGIPTTCHGACKERGNAWHTHEAQ